MITDFGLAKDVKSETRLTRAGVLVGTPYYMSPEQVDGNREAIDARSDVYSLGATLYEMLTLRPPFEGSTTAVIVKKGVLEDPVSPRKFNPGVDTPLATICLKCLQKDPAKRYGSAQELAEDLDRFLEGKPIVARPPSKVKALVRRLGRSRAVYVAVVCFALLASTYVAWDLVGDRGKPAEPPSPVPAPAPAPAPKSPASPEGRTAKVVWVVDGDTLHVMLDKRKEKVRLLQINAPEERQPFYRTSGKFLRNLVAGGKVLLVPATAGTKFTRGNHGRLLAYLFVDGRNVNVELVRAGMATFFTKYGRGRYGDAMEKAQREAKRAKRGIWSQR
jgi:endonuclease YncB( thermonuclease family)